VTAAAAVLAAVVLVAVVVFRRFRAACRRVDAHVAMVLADIDFERWEREMTP
jgi:hypothetical protein